MPAMVVSPVSLTPEELEQLKRTRPKMPTLLGLGAAFEEKAWELTPPAPDAAAATFDLSRRARARAPAAPEAASPAGSIPAAGAPPLDVPMADWDDVDDGPTQPEPDVLQADDSRRERRIMRELFAVIDGLRPLQRQRLEEQMSLEQLCQATPEALSDELQTPLERARELRNVVAAYGIERHARSTGADFAVQLAEAVSELARRSREFDACDEEQGKEQRLARQRRRDALSRLNLLLAERGELELLDVLEPCAIAERLERLHEWLGSGSSRQG
jgi:hypothetical protein